MLSENFFGRRDHHVEREPRPPIMILWAFWTFRKTTGLPYFSPILLLFTIGCADFTTKNVMAPYVIVYAVVYCPSSLLRSVISITQFEQSCFLMPLLHAWNSAMLINIDDRMDGTYEVNCAIVWTRSANGIIQEDRVMITNSSCSCDMAVLVIINRDLFILGLGNCALLGNNKAKIYNDRKRLHLFTSTRISKMFFYYFNPPVYMP